MPLLSNSAVSLLVLIWVLVWKGVALWKAVTKRHVLWFIILSVVNTLGILEILYLFWLGRWGIIDNKKVLDYLNEKIGRKIKTV